MDEKLKKKLASIRKLGTNLKVKHKDPYKATLIMLKVNWAEAYNQSYSTQFLSMTKKLSDDFMEVFNNQAFGQLAGNYS